jgi:hypothetical protein
VELIDHDDYARHVSVWYRGTVFGDVVAVGLEEFRATGELALTCRRTESLESWSPPALGRLLLERAVDNPASGRGREREESRLQPFEVE